MQKICEREIFVAGLDCGVCRSQLDEAVPLLWMLEEVCAERYSVSSLKLFVLILHRTTCPTIISLIY